MNEEQHLISFLGCLRLSFALGISISALEMNETLQNLKERSGLANLLGHDPLFIEQINRIPRIAKCDISVLITGETGTGKELVARAIHYLSHRAGKAFVPLNCGAIPMDLAENELFGHVQGAYTNAAFASPGVVCEADGGTLFLDELDSMPPMVQVKLLRFLQEKQYRPLGSVAIHSANVRVIAACNSDLHEALQSGKLREDLYYRINVATIHLPALRHRGGDIPLLAHAFLKRYADEFGKEVTEFSQTALQILMLHDWPGNVRELENAVERAVIASEKQTIQPDDISLSEPKRCRDLQRPFNELKHELIDEFERSYVSGVLASAGGNITKAAQIANKNRRAFVELIRRCGIDKARPHVSADSLGR